MSIMDTMRSRYSARKFSDVQVTDEELNAVLEAGRIAPSAKNIQPWRFVVIQSEEGLARMDRCSKCRYGAPTAILICFDESISAKNLGVPEFGWIDASLAIMQMCLEADELGLATCIVGAFDPEVTRREFNLPDNIVPVEFLPLGHSLADPSPRHESRLPLEEVTVRESF